MALKPWRDIIIGIIISGCNQHDRQDRPQHAQPQPFKEERPAYKGIGRPYQLHNLNFSSSCYNCNFNRIRDQEHGGEQKAHYQDKTDIPACIDKAEQLLNLSLSVFNLCGILQLLNLLCRFHCIFRVFRFYDKYIVQRIVLFKKLEGLAFIPKTIYQIGQFFFLG
ncbi:Uncharacterised protein [Mycobacteroides abscessus subsp. abscessus]|nr:Uncharacterised protein [Mycobacteroides abscessus subsp. abscessus]